MGRNAKLKRLRREAREREKKTKPKRRWPYIVGGLSLVAVPLVSVLICNSSSDNPTKQKTVRRVPKSKKKPKIPPAVIEIEEKELNKGNPHFREVDAILEKSLIKTGFGGLPYETGLKADVPEFMLALKRKLERRGFDITSGVSDPEEIFKKLFSFYMENNVWMLIRTAKKIDDRKGIEEEVACLLRFPIIGKASLSFSYFDGFISAEDVPIFYLEGDGLFEQDSYIGGVTLNRGLMVFTGASKTYDIFKNKIFDFVIHEGIHFRTMLLENEIVPHEYDYDRNANDSEPPEKTLARQKDELRAFLVQMMYGKKPRFALITAMKVKLIQYKYLQDALYDAVENMLRKDPRRAILYSTGRLSFDDFTEEEVRQLAYSTFRKHFLNK